MRFAVIKYALLIPFLVLLFWSVDNLGYYSLFILPAIVLIYWGILWQESKRMFSSEVFLSIPNERIKKNVHGMTIPLFLFIAISGFKDFKIVFAILTLMILFILMNKFFSKRTLKKLILQEDKIITNDIVRIDTPISSLTAIKTYTWGDYVKIEFSKAPSIWIDRDQYVKSDITIFLNHLVTKCTQPINISNKSRTKLGI